MAAFCAAPLRYILVQCSTSRVWCERVTRVGGSPRGFVIDNQSPVIASDQSIDRRTDCCDNESTTTTHATAAAADAKDVHALQRIINSAWFHCMHLHAQWKASRIYEINNIGTWFHATLCLASIRRILVSWLTHSLQLPERTAHFSDCAIQKRLLCLLLNLVVYYIVFYIVSLYILYFC